MRGLWYRILILWYRLGGATAAQAEWRARRRLEPKAKVEKAESDPRFTCACGQLMVQGDTVCPQCGRRQLMPGWARRAGRALGVRDESSAPMATFAMLITMVLGYLAQIRLGGSAFSPSGPGDAMVLGSSVKALTLGAQPWRAFTYTLVHGGLVHIGFNSVALVQVGPLVEERFGKARFLAAWVFGGIGGGLLSAVLARSPLASVVGASGAVFALIGMAGMQGHREGTSQGRQIRNTMIFWAVSTTVLGLAMPGMSHAGHMGGLIVGVAIAWALPPADHSPTRRRLTPIIGAAAVLTLLLSVGALVQWFAAGNPIPTDVPLRAQIRLTMDVVQARGGEVVYGEEGLAVLNRARRADGLSEADRMRIQVDANTLTADWPEVRRDLLRFQVMKALGRAAPRKERRAPSGAELLRQR